MLFRADTGLTDGYFSGEIKQAPSSAMRAMIAAPLGGIVFQSWHGGDYHYSDDRSSSVHS